MEIEVLTKSGKKIILSEKDLPLTVIKKNGTEKKEYKMILTKNENLQLI